MSLSDKLVKHSYVSILPSHAFTFGFSFLPSLFFCIFLITGFQYQSFALPPELWHVYIQKKSHSK